MLDTGTSFSFLASNIVYFGSDIDDPSPLAQQLPQQHPSISVPQISQTQTESLDLSPSKAYP
jgi:hypothetical protein